MIGHKKDKALAYLGQKQDKNLLFIGNKQDLNKNNGVNHMVGNGIIEQHKNLSPFQPLGLSANKM